MKQIETVPLEVWQELYNAAAEFKKLKCWQWMMDNNLFGVKNPEDNRTGYCCVMGNLGEFRALAVYLGTEGLNVHKQIYSGDLKAGHMSSLFLQKCLMVSFEDRDDLTEVDMGIIEELGIKFRGNSQWPLFRNYHPGYFPWYLNTADARFLTIALRQSSIMAKRFKENPEILKGGSKDQYLVRVNEKSKWADAWMSPSPEEKHFFTPLMDQTLLISLKNDGIKAESSWEAAFMQLPTPIKETTERPFYPYLFLIVNSDEKKVIGFDLSEPAKINMKIPALFLKTIQQENSYPEKLSIMQEEILTLIKPITDELKIKTQISKKLKAMEPLFNDFMSTMIEDLF